MTKAKQPTKQERSVIVQEIFEDILKKIYVKDLSYIEMIGILEIAKGTVLRNVEQAAQNIEMQERKQESKSRGDTSYIG